MKLLYSLKNLGKGVLQGYVGNSLKRSIIKYIIQIVEHRKKYRFSLAVGELCASHSCFDCCDQEDENLNGTLGKDDLQQFIAVLLH